MFCTIFVFFDIKCTSQNMCGTTDIVPGVGLYNLSSEINLPACDYVEVEQLEGLRPYKNDLSVLQLNIRGLLNKQGRLRDLINNGMTDIVLLCETWLNKETEALVSFDNYKLYSNPRKSRIGGVAILTDKSLRSRSRPDLHVESIYLEHIVVELKTDKDNILLVSGYRPPNANYKVFIKEYIALLKKLNKLKQHKIILGIDHNRDLLKAHLHKQTNQFLEKNLELDLVPSISKPTRITRKTATLIDNVLISQSLQAQMRPYLIVEDISDHLPILIVLRDLNKSVRGSNLIKSRNLNTNNIEKMGNDIRRHDWQNLLSKSNASQGSPFFTRYFVIL